MQKFLAEVDSPAKPQEMLDKAVQALQICSICSPGDLVGLKDATGIVQETKVNPGIEGLLNRAITKANAIVAPSPPCPSAQVNPGAIDLASMLGSKTKHPKVHIDLGSKVGRLNLKGLPQCFWPKSAAVDNLATEAAKLKKDKDLQDQPFIFVNLRQFLPSWAEQKATDKKKEDAFDVEQEAGDHMFDKLAEVLEKRCASDVERPKNGQRLDILRWALAFDKYAIAADAAGQMPFASAYAHKEICLNVALNAEFGDKKRRAALGVIYDEVARFVMST